MSCRIYLIHMSNYVVAVTLATWYRGRQEDYSRDLPLRGGYAQAPVAPKAKAKKVWAPKSDEVNMEQLPALTRLCVANGWQ